MRPAVDIAPVSIPFAMYGSVVAREDRIEYRPLQPVLGEAKIAAVQALATYQADVAVHAERQDRAMDMVLNTHREALKTKLATHRPGFERPSAILAINEKRPKEQDDLHNEWKEQLVKYKQAREMFKMQYGSYSGNVNSLSKSMFQRKQELQEMYDKCNELKAKLLAQASVDPEYMDIVRVPPKEMQHRQKVMGKELRELQAQIQDDSAKQRVAAADLRMQGIRRMQEEQRHLRGQLQLEREHTRLRVTALSARSHEHRRALSLGAPPWLANLTPRPWSG